jgi:hypothetical protein
MVPGTGMTPIVDGRIPIKERFLWAVLRRNEETNPGHQFSVDELTSILNVGTETLLDYFSELERNACVVFKIEYSTKLLQVADEEASTIAYLLPPNDPHSS